jgi:DNA repair protein RadC
MRIYDNLYSSEKNHIINSPQSACDYFVGFYTDKQDREYFSAAFLDISSNVIKTKVIFLYKPGTNPWL